MKYAVETGSGAMICIPSFIKICSGIQTLIVEGFSDSMVIAPLNFALSEQFTFGILIN
jgi:hypothetical protein